MDEILLQKNFTMKRRKIVISIIGVLVLAGAIFLSRQLSSSPPENQTTQSGKSVAVVVESKKVENQPIDSYINITGRLQPEDKIDIYAEVSGVFEGAAKPFKVGVPFRKGQVLMKINDEEARQNMFAQKNGFINTLAQVVPDLKIDYPEIYESWKNYLLEIDTKDNLPPLPETSTDQQKLFLTGRNIYSQYYNIKQLEARLSKYTIYAPFNGTLTEVNINQGTLVRNMQRLGEFMRTGVYELEAALNIDELQHVSSGQKIKLKATSDGKSYNGTVTRINEKVDQQTQTVKTFVRVVGAELKSGMYMEGRILAQTFEESLQLPRESLIEQSKVFIIKDSIATLQKVDVLDISEDQAVIKGLSDGLHVITEGRNASFEGTKVTSSES